MVLGVLGVAVGLVLVNVTHMTAFYRHGAINCVSNAVNMVEWQRVDILNAYDTRAPANPVKIYLGAAGFVTTAAFAALRRYSWFPLHPVGFLVACAAGARHAVTIFLVWLIKWFILKYFGGRLHRSARNLFLGLVMGHFTIAMIWGMLSLFAWPPTQRYFIGFW